MPATLEIKKTDLTLDQVKDFFSIFIDVYKITSKNKNFDFSIQEFLSSNDATFDYRPFIGSKFFIQKNGNKIDVWGYK